MRQSILNSTAVATSRALVAIMEQNQLEDGRVSVPEVLRPYMGGQEILENSVVTLNIWKSDNFNG